MNVYAIMLHNEWCAKTHNSLKYSNNINKSPKTTSFTNIIKDYIKKIIK